MRRIASLLLLVVAGCHAGSPAADSARAPWTVSRVVNAPDASSVVEFSDGRRFDTGLHDARYLGRIAAGEGAPYLVLAGRGCTDCDQNLGVYIQSPAEAPTVNQLGERYYSYPGTESEWEPESPGDTIASRTRFFLGDCLPRVGARAIWFMDERVAPARLAPRVFFVGVEGGRLREGELPVSGAEPRFPGLDEVLVNVRRGTCQEIRGIEQSREP